MPSKKKLVRKVILRPKASENEASEQAIQEEPSRLPSRRVCLFCKNQSLPSYTDLVTLRKFLTDRAKILPKSRSGICSKHQRAVAKNIKYGRHLALLPFVPKV